MSEQASAASAAAEAESLTERWVAAAEVLGAEVTQRLIVKCERRALGDDEVAAEALPHAMVNVAAGHPEGASVRYAIAEAMRNRAIRGARLLSAEALSEAGWQPTDEGQPERNAAPYWEEVLPRLSPTAQRVLSPLPSHLLSAQGAYEALAAGRVRLTGAQVADAMELTLASASSRKGKRQRRALLRLACAGWAEASQWLSPSATETLAQRALRAERWVRRGRVYSEGAAGTVRTSEVRVTQRGARLMRADGGPGAFVPLSGGAGAFVAPNDGQPVRSLGYRPAAQVKRIRSPRPTDGVAEGVAWGGAGALGLPPREVPPALAGQRAQRAQKRDDVATQGWQRRATAEALGAEATPQGWLSGDDEGLAWVAAAQDGRAGVCPTARDGVCGCPRTRTRGKGLRWVVTQPTDEYLSKRSRARALGEPAPTAEAGVWLHPLTQCASPRDGMCGCPSKRGALVWLGEDGFHPAQPRRASVGARAGKG